jgi:hypothetical protein
MQIQRITLRRVRVTIVAVEIQQCIHPLEPNGHYSGRTAQLISRICI